MLKSIYFDFANNLVTYVDERGIEGSFHFRGLKELSPLIVKVAGIELPDDSGFNDFVAAMDSTGSALI